MGTKLSQPLTALFKVNNPNTRYVLHSYMLRKVASSSRKIPHASTPPSSCTQLALPVVPTCATVMEAARFPSSTASCSSAPAHSAAVSAAMNASPAPTASVGPATERDAICCAPVGVHSSAPRSARVMHTARPPDACSSAPANTKY